MKMFNKIINKKIITILLVVLAVLGMTACSKKTDKKAEGGPVKIRFANLTIGLTSAYDNIGIKKGIFEKYGIDLQVINFRGGAEAAAGIASKQVDMGSFGTPILISISKGFPIKLVAAPADKWINFVLVGANHINSIADLKGKTVATGGIGGGNHQSFVTIIEKSGLKETDVRVMATGGVDAFMIIKSGQVDAIQTSEPTVSQIVADGAGHVLAEAKDYYGDYQHSFIFATDDFIENHPDAIRNFLKASRESLEYCRDHFEELVAEGKTLVGLDEPIIRKFYENDIKKWDLTFQIDLKGTANAVEIVKNLGEIDKNISFDEKTWVNFDFLE